MVKKVYRKCSNICRADEHLVTVVKISKNEPHNIVLYQLVEFFIIISSFRNFNRAHLIRTEAERRCSVLLASVLD